MTIDHPLRRALARVCSADTMSRIVDPVLADMRWEDGRATLPGCASLAAALMLHGVISLPRWCAAVWSDDDHAMPRAAGLVAAAALVAGALLIAPSLSHPPYWTGMSFVSFAIVLAPQAFALSLPLAVIIAVPLALRRLRITARLIRRTLLLCGLVMAATYAVITWAMPNANQSFRVMVSRALGSRVVHVPRGVIETDWKTLRQQIRELRRTDNGRRAAAQLEYAYQSRVAVVVAAVPLGLAGLAISTWRFGRRRPVLTGAGVLIVYWALMAYEERTARALIAAGGLLPEYLCPWTPNAILLIASAAAILRSRQFLPPSPARSSPVA